MEPTRPPTPLGVEYAKESKNPLPVVQLYTVGQIADRLDIRLHNVLYMIKKRAIKEHGRAGVARVFSPDIITTLRGELRRRRKLDKSREKARTLREEKEQVA